MTLITLNMTKFNWLQQDPYLLIIFNRKIPYLTLTLIGWSAIITFLSMTYPILWSYFSRPILPTIEIYPWTWLTHIFLHGRGDLIFTFTHLGSNVFFAIIIGLFTEKVLGSPKTLGLMLTAFTLNTMADLTNPSQSFGCSGIIYIYKPIFCLFACYCFRYEGLRVLRNPIFVTVLILTLFSIFPTTIYPLLTGNNRFFTGTRMGVDAHIIALTVGSTGAFIWKNEIKRASGIKWQLHNEFLLNQAWDNFSKGVAILLTIFLATVLIYIPFEIKRLSEVRKSEMDRPIPTKIQALNQNKGHLLIDTKVEMIPIFRSYSHNLNFNPQDGEFIIRHQWLDNQTILFTFNRDLKKRTDSFAIIGTTKSISGKRYEFGILLGREFENIITVWADVIPEGTINAILDDTVRMYHRAAEQGQVIAQTTLGLKYASGEDTDKNPQKAIHWYTKAAEQNDPIAMFYLGQMYYLGNGISKDYDEAFKWFKKAAEQGHAQAQNDLGTMYYAAIGRRQNFFEARKWF